MQSLFVIRNGVVILQNETKTYNDTAVNFVKDGGTVIGNNIDYNKGVERYLVNGVPKKYPNQQCEDAIANIQVYLDAKMSR